MKPASEIHSEVGRDIIHYRDDKYRAFTVSDIAKIIEDAKAESKGVCEWRQGEPKEAGYYLATTKTDDGYLGVSELWFNPTGGGGIKWWKTRGYLGERSCGMNGAITQKVVGWMPIPTPYGCGKEIKVV